VVQTTGKIFASLNRSRGNFIDEGRADEKKESRSGENKMSLPSKMGWFTLQDFGEALLPKHIRIAGVLRNQELLEMSSHIQGQPVSI
jgi:hypothetical protein